MLSKEEAKRLSIISVAEQLGMELKRTGSYSYNWVEHDSFIIDTKKNEFYWNSRTEFGDVIQLVQTIRGVSYKEAMHFLETGEFKEVDLEAQTASKEPFSYHLERYERQDFSASRRYLKAQRGLSDDTINFFISQGSISEVIRKKGDYFEPVIVFKYKDNTGFLAGASLQGIVENREHYPERGRLKQIMRNSDGQLGFSIDIGRPKRLVFAEAPIDLMSYYELHKDALQDVRLVAMDGVKEGIISRRFMELYAEINDKSYQINQNTGKALETVVRTTNYFKDGQHQDMITLAVDNDMAGHKFITSLQEKGIPVQIAIPPILQRGQEKEDWNDFLKGGNNTPKELAHVYTADEKSWHYQGFFEKELALAKAQELTADDVKAFVSDRQLTKEEVRQEYQTIINQERGRKNSMSELHEHSSDHEEDLVNSHKQADRVRIQPETQAIIDSGEVKQWAKHPHIYFVKGLRQVALELTEEGKFEQSSQYLPNTDEEKEVVNKLLSKQKNQDEVVLEDDQSSILNVDTSHLSPEDAEWLKQNWHNISFSVEPKKQMVIDSDKTVTFEKPSDPVGDTYKAQEENQSKEKALETSQEQMNDRASGGEGYSQPDAVGSAKPDAESSATFEQTVTSHPTSPYRYLHFSTNFEEVQRRQSKYHPITPDDLKRMNQYAASIQKSSQWYLEELANSKIYYFYSSNGEVSLLDVNFKRENFLHLTGIRPVVPGKNAGDFVVDFAEGRGDYNQILVSNSLKEKLQVIPMLEDILDPKSFVLDNLDEVRIAQRLNFSEAIKSKDEDFLLLFKDIGEDRVPASLMKIKRELRVDVEKTKEKVILGVFRDRDGRIEQLSINEDYIKNDGKELQSIMENGLFEAIHPNEIDKNNYNVRLQWAEKHDGGPILPFSETELIDYQSFATELYKQNNIYYEKHHASVSDRMNQIEGASYTPFTKVQFALYNPDGELIQDGIRYDIGDEINPIAHKERLGTREMREHPELMKIDGALFNQYHLERLVSELDISQFSYALEDTPYADQLLSQLPYGDLKNSPIGFTDSSHDGRLGFISFDGMDSVEVDNLSAWFEKLGVRNSPQEQVAFVEKWQNEIKELSEKVEQTIVNVRDEFEKTQVKNSQNTLDNPYEKIYQYNRKDERDRDLDGDGISNSDEMLQGTDPYNGTSNLHKKQEDRERRIDAEAETGAIITEMIAAKSSEQTISQLVANKDTKALAEHLKEGMKNYLDSEQFKSFLDTMSKFHNYSLNNIHLLKMQNPNVSQVASFNKWKTDFDRTVKKGSKALKIWVPYQVKTSIPVHQKELDFTPAENEMEQKEITVTRFKLGNVFDVSQTEGKELPKAIHELTGSVKDYEDLYRAAKAVSMDNQVSISFEEIKRESANGYYSPNENRIVISKELKGQEHILKTIFHEMAHSDLHRGTNAQYGDDQYRKQELQAESVAYVVANHFGFDTSSYSFGYLAIWAKDKNGFEDMVEQLQIVQKEAKSLIDRMDAKLELVKNKTVTKDKFADKLQQAKEKSEQLGNQKAEAVKQVEEKKSLSSPQ
ncbi:DNA primase [Streptococcus pneumoniae]|nr:PBECR4 domain-containing protein [Streptococcus pneumoniae]CEZ49780.1 DNA primase [Streptococcus pneumoniae]COL58693.1 DNA primase [Streptococcus pneumoniae]COQ36705.1 DNA primase [Streptococcus pneumoniae]VRR71369.1 putative conjugative transposon membrane protein [Streptococcus pneumoniae]